MHYFVQHSDKNINALKYETYLNSHINIELGILLYNLGEISTVQKLGTTDMTKTSSCRHICVRRPTVWAVVSSRKLYTRTVYKQK